VNKNVGNCKYKIKIELRCVDVIGTMILLLNSRGFMLSWLNLNKDYNQWINYILFKLSYNWLCSVFKLCHMKLYLLCDLSRILTGELACDKATFGTMKYTLKAHVCYFVLMVGLLHYLYSLHPDFYTLENIINLEKNCWFENWIYKNFFFEDLYRSNGLY
jgi:hypothetical protein